jgi:hypothetical protein
MPGGIMPGDIMPGDIMPGDVAGTGGSGPRIGVEGRNEGGSELDVGLGECESAPMLL